MQVSKQQLELDMEQQTASKSGKERTACILSPCSSNVYAEYILWNARLDEAQAGIKTAGRNSNNLRYPDEIALTAKSEEELKSFLMKEKKEHKSWFKTQHSKKLRSWHPATSLHSKQTGKQWKQW